MHVCTTLVCTLAALTAALAPCAATAQGDPYSGICDGSAGMALDSDHFVVADDDHNILRIFRRRQPENVGSLDLIKFLDSPKKNKKGPKGEDRFDESDIEGAAQIDDRIYWISSHGRDSKGGEDATRARFFATRIVKDAPGPRLEPVGAAYKRLREDMFTDPNLIGLGLNEAYGPKKDGPEPEAEIGFNIEGLAATPEGHLLIGFRNPRPDLDHRAILVPLTNPAEVVEKGAKPLFGKPFRPDLGGLGIRSIERVGDRYVIVGGPHNKADESSLKPPFILFAWSDKHGDVAHPIPDITFTTDFTPEALFSLPGSDEIMLLSDDGDLQRDGKTRCKDEPDDRRKFKAMTNKLPK